MSRWIIWPVILDPNCALDSFQNQSALNATGVETWGQISDMDLPCKIRGGVQEMSESFFHT